MAVGYPTKSMTITAIITPPCAEFKQTREFNLNLPSGLVSMRAWPKDVEAPSTQTILGNLHYCSLEDYYRPDYLNEMPQGWERLEAFQAWQRSLWQWVNTFITLDSLQPGYFKPDGRYVSAMKAKVKLPNRATYLRQFHS